MTYALYISLFLIIDSIIILLLAKIINKDTSKKQIILRIVLIYFLINTFIWSFHLIKISSNDMYFSYIIIFTLIFTIIATQIFFFININIFNFKLSSLFCENCNSKNIFYKESFFKGVFNYFIILIFIFSTFLLFVFFLEDKIISNYLLNYDFILFNPLFHIFSVFFPVVCFSLPVILILFISIILKACKNLLFYQKNFWQCSKCHNSNKYKKTNFILKDTNKIKSFSMLKFDNYFNQISIKYLGDYFWNALNKSNSDLNFIFNNKKLIKVKYSDRYLSSYSSILNLSLILKQILNKNVSLYIETIANDPLNSSYKSYKSLNSDIVINRNYFLKKVFFANNVKTKFLDIKDNGYISHARILTLFFEDSHTVSIYLDYGMDFILTNEVKFYDEEDLINMVKENKIIVEKIRPFYVLYSCVNQNI